MDQMLESDFTEWIFHQMMFYEYISSVKINESIEYLSNEIVGLICNHQIGLSWIRVIIICLIKLNIGLIS